MKWRSPRFLLLILVVFIVLAIGGFGIFWYFNHVDRMAQVTHSYFLKDIPASTASLTTYNDSEYNFMVSYPSDWTVNKRDFNGSEYIHFSYQIPTGPDIYPLDIICTQNSQHLTGTQWWDQNGDGTKVTEMSLLDGSEEIVSSGHGQTDYTQNTFVTSQRACKIYVYAANSDNSSLIAQVAKSFKWQ